ncbi:MAG: hypothetical protein ACK52S_21700 [Pirellula sp.]
MVTHGAHLHGFAATLFVAVVGSKVLAGGDAVSTLNDDKPPTMITVARDTDG